LHPYYAGRAGFDSSLYPRTMQLYPRIVSLPLYPNMTEKQVKYVIDCVKEIVAATRISPQPMGMSDVHNA
jgi:dTDP-4-amino-4,6-dideoxygalactose transaminase